MTEVPRAGLADRAAREDLTPPKNLLSLQVLRAAAALLVVLVHVGVVLHGRYGYWALPEFTKAGHGGVDIFFCLSGFIMYYTSRGDFAVPGAWRSFLTRRVLRIYPIYWIALIALLALGAWPGSHLEVWARYTPSRLIKSALLFPQEVAPLLFQAWTLVHEVRFYLIFGLLLLLPRRPALGLLWVWGAVSFGVLLVSYVNQPLLDSSRLARALTFLCHPASAEFVLGAFAAIVVAHWRTPIWLDRLVLPVGLLIMAVVSQWYTQLAPKTKYEGLSLFLVPSFLLVLGAALAERRWRPSMPKLAVAMGDASYSTYLFHFMLAMLMVWTFFPASASATVQVLGAVALVVFIHAVSWVIHRGIEAPLHRLARVLTGGASSRRRAAATPAPEPDGTQPVESVPAVA